MDIIELLMKLDARAQADLDTEADTRAIVVDPILEALGWPPQSIKREPYSGWKSSKGFADYLLLVRDKPYLVVEVKKTGRHFSLPTAIIGQSNTTFGKLRAIANDDLNEALDQCLRYGVFCGAQYTCATNGIDWLFFKPSHPHRPLPDAKVVIFSGIKSILSNINKFSDLLGRTQLENGLAESHLIGKTIKIPTFNRRLRDQYTYRPEQSVEVQDYANILDNLLKFYVEDLLDEAVFKDCYVPVAVNRRTETYLDAIISNKAEEILTSAFISSNEFSNSLITNNPVIESSTGRLIVLHGPRGVGKSSFIRYCHRSLYDTNKLNRVIWASVNLIPFRDRPFDPSSTSQMLVLICKQLQEAVALSAEGLSGNYDPSEWAHLRDIYSTEARRFQKSRFPESDDTDKDYLKEVRNYIWELKEKDPQEHLLRILRWFTLHCKLPVVLILDNSDQLGLDFQEFLYKLTESMQARTSAVVILVIRTEALASHRIHEHSLASVHEQYAIQKAPLPVVLERRFRAANKFLLESGKKVPPQYKVVLDRIMVLMDTIQYEAHIGSDAFTLIESIGNDTLRDSLNAISALFRDSPKRMDKLVADQYQRGQARLRSDHVLKAILRQSKMDASPIPLVPNIFPGDAGVIIPYTLGMRILQQVRSRTSLGQYFIHDLLSDLTSAGIDKDIAKRTIEKLISDKLLALPHMLKEFRGEDPIRLTLLAEGFFSVILNQLAYYEHCSFDSVIYEEKYFINFRSIMNSDTERWKKLKSLTRSYIEMLKADDISLRESIMTPMLEPVISVAIQFPEEPTTDQS